MANKQTFSVRVDPDIWKAAKKFAIDKNTTLSDLVEEAILEVLKKSGLDIKKLLRK